MRLDTFPDINWLRKQAETGFKDQLTVQNQPLNKQGWPNVVLNTTVRQCERDNILAPFSLFMNRSGVSNITVDNRTVNISENNFVIVNKNDRYNLQVNTAETQTFNIHFGDDLYHSTMAALLNDHIHLIDDPALKSAQFNLRFRSHIKTNQLEMEIDQLINYYRQQNQFVIDDPYEELILTRILTILFSERVKNLKGLQRLSVLKASTRDELVKRLLKTANYIQENYSSEINLNQLAELSCLSKFHLVRTFTELFHMSPIRFQQQIRMKRAEILLKKTKISISEIAFLLGFKEENSFRRLFKVFHKTSPSEYRIN